MTTPERADLAAEQTNVDRLYGRLDELRARSAAELHQARRAGATGTPAARSERDARVRMLEDRLARFDAVDRGLVFGRIDTTTGERHYIGRIGLSSDEYERLLVDWRAPAARPFYTATPGSPEGVHRRRHLRVRDRKVTGVDDEVFDLDALAAADRSRLSGEAALLASLTEGRTGRMRDIVATIQSEQDAVIRSDLAGVLVVQGGSGTGKTAVALHRAAYLLYEHRDRLASRGVLVVGPNPVFLGYIDQVLPSLGETGVVTTTVSGLYPGVTPTATEPADVAALKGDARLADVVAELVRFCQRVPDRPTEIRYGRHRISLDAALVRRARTRARRSRRPHNRARATFQRQVYTALAERALASVGETRPSRRAVTDTASELLGDDALAAAVDRLWPYLTPERLLAGLFATASLRDLVARALTPEERDLLARDRDHGWTAADVALLDEAAERLGPVPVTDPLADLRAEEDRWESAAAEDVLGDLDVGAPVGGADVVRRYRGQDTRRTAAELAAQDREWTYGHVIVDEAQELSPMAWRMLQRRCPGRSMTVVGDLAQAGVSWAPKRWEDVLEEYARGRLRVTEVSVNYRTPAEIMAVAGEVLRADSPDAPVPESIRRTDRAPWSLRAPGDRLVDVLAGAVAEEATAVGEGMVAVLTPPHLTETVDGQLAERLPDLVRPGRGQLDSPVVVLDVTSAKGLEFDAVVVLEPAAILAGSRRGAHDLYVALSRATRYLGVVHTEDLPDAMRGLSPRPA